MRRAMALVLLWCCGRQRSMSTTAGAAMLSPRDESYAGVGGRTTLASSRRRCKGRRNLSRRPLRFARIAVAQVAAGGAVAQVVRLQDLEAVAEVGAPLVAVDAHVVAGEDRCLDRPCRAAER